MKTIGINIKLPDGTVSLWSNGVRQNIYFLAQTLQLIGKYKVLVVNTNPRANIQKIPTWNLQECPVVHFDEVKDQLDLYFLMGAEIPPEQGHYLRKRGCRVVHYVCGSRYIMDMESILFKGGKGGMSDESYLDEVWLLPHMMKTCLHFFDLIYQKPVVEVPYIWGPHFIDTDAKGLPNRGRYQQKSGAQRLSCFEPNINVVKFCLYDMLIVEKAYRMRPELIREMYITNTQEIRKTQRFTALAGRLDIVRKGIASFEDRFAMPYFLSKFTDIVVAHQWENGLNNAYFDILHLKYPLVHNADFIKDAGYYYEGFDAQQGAEQLIRAASAHASNSMDYERRSTEVLSRFSYANPRNVAFYAREVNRLLSNGENG